MGRGLCAAVTAILGCYGCATGHDASDDAGTRPDDSRLGDAIPPGLDAPATDASAAPSLQLEPEQVWASGQAPVVLGAVAKRMCFLTSVSGSFDEGNEVNVYASAGSWYVAGTGAVRAVARCITWTNGGLTVSASYSWLQGQAAVVMGAEANQVCGLTRMAGQFRGSGEVIRTYVEAATWRLGGNSQQAGVGATAHCLSWPASAGITSLGELAWAQGQAPQNLGSGNRACLMTMVSGSFRGFGERVAIEQQGVWQLTGSSQQAGVAARARCLAY
jgi:hypothetical protein